VGDSLRKILTEQRVVIAIGAGGVGKTTSSIAMSVQAAKLGRRVGLISIDPAKRLAAALGIGLTGELKALNLGAEFKGTIHAAMLDQNAVFGSMVDRFAKDGKQAEKIKQHRFYQAASENLAGALEFMALAKLGDMIESAQFDLIVVDTPPDAHAVDFLARPDTLSRFIDNKVTNVLLKPFALAQKFGLGSLLRTGEKLMGGMAKVTGMAALQMMAEFILLMQDVLSGFNQAGKRVQSVLRSPDCSFVLVTALRRGVESSAVQMRNVLKEMEHDVDAVIVNRVIPAAIRKDVLSMMDIDSADLKAIHSAAQLQSSILQNLRKSFPSVPVVEVPEQNQSIDGIDAIHHSFAVLI
jgi:anion-transporting  ArsA/GET3 family ATPase